MLNISKAVNLILLCAFVLITGSCCQRTDDANKLTASMPAVKSQPSSTLTPVTTSAEDLKLPYIQLSYLNQPILKPDKRICQPLTKKNLNEKLMLDTAGGGKEYKSEFISANGKSLSQAALEQEVVQRKTRKFFYRGEAIEVEECLLPPIKLGVFVQGQAKRNKLLFMLKQPPNMPAEIKLFMQEHFAYREELPNSLAYALYTVSGTKEERDRIYAWAFMPSAYKIKIKNQTYYVLKSSNMAFSNQLAAEQRYQDFDYGDNTHGLIWDNYCDGVYQRFSFFMKK